MKEKKPILQANDIYKAFHKPHHVQVLEGISLSLFPQSSIAIMGASGEGKTTLLHILGTLESADKGTLQIKDKIATKSFAPQIRNRHIGFVFQFHNLLEDYTALENVLMPAKIGRNVVSKGSPFYEKGQKLLKEVGLEKRMYFPTKLLSGGERQRTAIARALCNDPEIILADEPSGNLDHSHSSAIHELLLSSVKKRNKSLIIVTHDNELADLCDEKYLLRDGKITKI